MGECTGGRHCQHHRCRLQLITDMKRYTTLIVISSLLTVSRCGRSGWRDSTEQYLNNQLSSSATSLVSAQIHDAFSSGDQSRRVKQDQLQEGSGGQRKKRRLGVKKVKKFRRLHSYEDLRERDNVIKVAVAKKRRRNDDANNGKSDLMDDQKYYD